MKCVLWITPGLWPQVALEPVYIHITGIQYVHVSSLDEVVVGHPEVCSSSISKKKVARKSQNVCQISFLNQDFPPVSKQLVNKVKEPQQITFSGSDKVYFKALTLYNVKTWHAKLKGLTVVFQLQSWKHLKEEAHHTQSFPEITVHLKQVQMNQLYRKSWYRIVTYKK